MPGRCCSSPTGRRGAAPGRRAFIWKQLGTAARTGRRRTRRPGVQRAADIAAPPLLFKSEAIVHPDEVVRYISPGECQLSYNPLLMALLWEAWPPARRGCMRLARHRFRIPEGSAWVNYLRCHDDIGWTFDDEDARELGIDGSTTATSSTPSTPAASPASFARGLPFQENPAPATAASPARWPRWPGSSRRSRGRPAEIELPSAAS